MSLFSPSRKPRVRKRFMVRYVLWNALRRTCTFIGALVLLSALISAFATSALLKGVQKEKPLPEEMVLFWRASSGLSEGAANPSLGDPYSFLRQGNGFLDTIDALEKARHDDRVKGLVVMLSDTNINMAHLFELRQAISRFRDAGKFAYVTALSYGQMGRGLGTYYLASSFDEVWLHPVGTLSLGGIYLEAPYGQEMLNKIGLEAQFFQREEYKGIFEGAKRQEMSPASREMNEAMVKSLADSFVTGIVESRTIEKDVLKELIDKGVMTDQEALESGLVDRLDYIENLERLIKEKVKGDPEFKGDLLVQLGKYGRKVSGKIAVTSEQKTAKHKHKANVALIYINGALMDAEAMPASHASGYAFFSGDSIVSARQISSALRDIADDKAIETVVLRINSPGGTPMGAEIVHHAIRAAQDKGKKVIVSMGGMAASAGYWIAAPADVIYTTPATLTGSIGVAGGKFSAEKMWQKIGVNWESVNWGENAGMMSLNHPFSQSEIARMNALMDSTYQTFLDRVAAGRGLDVEAVRKIAKGRVWTGQQAVDLGLADEIGGLGEALDHAAVLAGAEGRMAARVSVFPKPKKPIEQIIEILEQQAMIGQAAEMQRAFFSLFQPAIKSLSLSAAAPDGRLSYEFRTVR